MTEPTFEGTGSQLRARREWLAEGAPKANILLVHGLGEHSGRYDHVGGFLAAHGYSVYAFDLQGHGASGGDKGHIDDFSVFVDQIAEEFDRLPTDAPRVLYGHSMGGLLSLTYAIDREPEPDKLVLSAPSVQGNAAAWQRAAAPLFGKLVPKLSMPTALKGEQLATDPAVGEAYFADPLVLTKVTTAFGAAFFRQMDWAEANAMRLSVPTYVFTGGDDPLVPPSSSVELGALPNVTRKLWPGLRHETHNEPAWEDVLGDVVAWLDA